MPERQALLLGLVVSLITHVVFAWPWSLIGALVAGLLVPAKGWRMGAIVLCTSWGLLLGVNLLLAATPVYRFFSVMGGLLGGLPAPIYPVLVLVAAFVLGSCAGGLGGTLMALSDTEY